jgi:hypothetical protein
MYWINLRNYAKVPATVTSWTGRGAIDYESAPGVWTLMASGKKVRAPVGGVALAPNENKTFVAKWSYTPIAGAWGKRFRVFENYAWDAVIINAPKYPAITYTTGTFYSPKTAVYWSDTFRDYGSADIFGQSTILREGDTMWGKGDGIVNIKDATPIGDFFINGGK